MTTDEQGPRVLPLTPALGAAVTGVDLARPLGNAAFDAIHRALLKHLVLVFPGQDMAPADQIAFTRRFGAVEPHPLGARAGHPDHPELLVLENRPGRPGASNDFWHSDISCAELPPALSLLHALTVPEGYGDTMFCNTARAYETLSDGMRAMLDGLSAEHSGDAIRRRNAAQAGSDGRPMEIEEVPPPAVHPVVRRHPETGDRALYVDDFFTTRFAGMTEAESRPLIAFLVAHATRPDNVYRHCWRPGDAVLWDNRATMHYAVRDYDETMPRRMHRTTAAGDRPTA